MAKRARSARREYFWLAMVGAVLIAAIALVRANDDAIKSFIDQKPFWGVFLYIVLNILDAVIAPGATLPLIPVAAHVWGPVLAAIVTTIGWTAGSLIAFLIAREWGYPLVKKLTSTDRLKQLKKYIDAVDVRARVPRQAAECVRAHHVRRRRGRGRGVRDGGAPAPSARDGLRNIAGCRLQIGLQIRRISNQDQQSICNLQSAICNVKIYCEWPRAVIGHTTSTRSLRVP